MKQMFGLGTDSFLNVLAKKNHRRGIPVIIMSDFCRDREGDERIDTNSTFQEDCAMGKR